MSIQEEYERIPWLHLYAQYWEHDEARIIGTAEGLTALRDAIDEALKAKNGEAFSKGMTGDGEGYSIKIHKVPRFIIHDSTLPYYYLRSEKP